MPDHGRDPAARMRRAWQVLHGLPGGRWLFSRLLGRMIPYTGSIRPEVLTVPPTVEIWLMPSCSSMLNPTL